MQKLLCYRRTLTMLGGLFTGLTLIFPAALGWLEWLSPALALPALWHLAEAAEEKRRYRWAYGLGVAFFFPFYLVSFHWFLALYPLSFAGFSPTVAALVVGIAWLGLTLFQTLGMALTFVAIVALWRLPLACRRLWLRPLLAAAVLTVAEWIQTLFWFGVPWARLSLGQAVYLPIVQTASLFGCYGVTFLIIAVSLSLGQMLISPKGGRRVLCLLGTGLFVGNLALGSVLYLVAEGRTPTARASAGIVQGNFSTVSKWDATISETMTLHMAHMESLTAEGVDFILLPETSLAFFLQDHRLYCRQIGELAERGGATVFAGTFTYDEEGTEYSSVMTFHKDGSIDDKIYHKQHLVPFGEFVPLRGLVTALIPPLAELNMWDSELGAGKEATQIEDDKGRYGFLICFDSIYETAARESVREGAELLLLSTNDSWFLDSAAVRMHHNQARLRAIECGRAIVRAANTGISSLITPSGRVCESLGPLLEGTVQGEVNLYTHTTPYVLLGNWFVLACGLFVVLPIGHKIVQMVQSHLDKKRRT